MRISVIIPCYMSRLSLPDLVTRLHRQLAELTTAYEIIMVVDGSPDDTYTVARELENEHPDTVRAVLLRRNYGQHNALVAGLDRAQYPITVTIDDDLQHLPEEIPALVAPLADPTVDLVYGVATQEEHGFLRSFASRLVKSALRLAGVPAARDVSAFRAFRTELRDGFAHVADPFASIDVLLSWTTTAIRRVDVEMAHRTIGESGYTFRKLVRHAMNMATGYGTAPLKLVTWMGIAWSAFGFVLLVVVLWNYFTNQILVAGFTTITAMLALLSGGIMLSLGILGEYLGRLHFRSMQRPTFLVRVDGRSDGPRAGLPGLEVPSVTRERHPDEVADAIRAAYLAPQAHERA